MPGFDRILMVVEDPSAQPRALARLGKIAAPAAEITLFHAFEPPTAGLLRRLRGMTDQDLVALELESRLHRLAEWARVALPTRTGGTVRTKVALGIPFLEAIREVLRGDHDLVVKEAPMPGRRAARLGSFDLHLLRKCPCPVLLERHGRARGAGRIVAAVNPDDPDAVHADLDARIVSHAATLARVTGGSLHLLHAWQLFGESALRTSRAGPLRAELDEMLARERSGRFDAVSRLATERTGGLAARVVLVKGDPEKVLPPAIRRLDPDLLVMGTVARHGIPGLLIGNTAETILSQVSCSVLTLKPMGFQSPVKLPAASDEDSWAGEEFAERVVHGGASV